jgi:hypothetical protein
MSDMQDDEDMISVKTYQSILGSCRFLADTTHPEIAYITGIAGQHAHRPTARHMQAIKIILRYLTGATNSGLHYPSRQTDICRLLPQRLGVMLTNPKTSNRRPFCRQRLPSALDIDQTTHDITF